MLCSYNEIEVKILPVDNLGALEAKWRDLENRANASFFLSWTWIGCWLDQVGRRPLLLEASTEGRTVGLGLFHSARHVRHGWLPVASLILHETGDPDIDSLFIEYNGFLIERGLEQAATRRFLEFLTEDAGGASPPWDELRVGGVRECYGDLLAATGLPVRAFDRKPSAAVDLELVRNSGRDYLSFLSANTRQQIRRSNRLYQERGGGIAVEAARDVPEALSFLDGLKGLHQETWRRRGKPGIFASPFFEAFHRTLIARAMPSGAVELLRVRTGSDVIGYLYNFVQGNWVGNYASGYAYEADARLKPGMVCLSLAVERHLARGAACFDFMAGESRYKTSLATTESVLYWFSLRRPRLKFRIEDLMRNCRDAVRERLEEMSARD